MRCYHKTLNSHLYQLSHDSYFPTPRNTEVFAFQETVPAVLSPEYLISSLPHWDRDSDPLQFKGRVSYVVLPDPAYPTDTLRMFNFKRTSNGTLYMNFGKWKMADGLSSRSLKRGEMFSVTQQIVKWKACRPSENEAVWRDIPFCTMIEALSEAKSVKIDRSRPFYTYALLCRRLRRSPLINDLTDFDV